MNYLKVRKIEVDYCGNVSGHGGHEANTLNEASENCRQLRAKAKNWNKERHGLDFDLFIGFTVYMNEGKEWGKIYYCTQSYLDLTIAEKDLWFSDKENAEIYINALKECLETGKPVKYQFV